MERVVHDYFPEERSFQRGEGPVLFSYHYTRLDALLNILRTKQIWLFHARDMNDSTEGRLILDKATDNTKESKDYYNLLTENLFLCSFSNYGNLLSQWRAYGDVSLGFSRDLIETDSRFIEDEKGELLDTSGVQFTECEYVNVDDSHFGEVVDLVRKEIAQTPSGPVNELQYNLLKIGMICFSQKHSGFREEEECRLFSYLWNRSPKQHNEKKYIAYRLNPSSIRRIVVGPSRAQSEKLAKILTFLKENQEYASVEVYRSGIPYVGSDGRNGVGPR